MLVMAKSNDKSAADDVKLTVDINDKSREQVTLTQHILTLKKIKLILTHVQYTMEI